ncbi:hypothetical protein [Campylobacter upsaliensis]|uniref:hypothetical protein n=1 Tax=Campylobacter upsaliensis TaxID=28080 RepID=UPI0022EAC8F6|nr:hypothetical protein [Campylobacter upsaliensis]ELS3708340.1 hypothetical protein [Campylobacter upsaliensis]
MTNLCIYFYLCETKTSIVNNAAHYAITHPYPQAPDFANGRFVSSANIGLSTAMLFRVRLEKFK